MAQQLDGHAGKLHPGDDLEGQPQQPYASQDALHTRSNGNGGGMELTAADGARAQANVESKGAVQQVMDEASEPAELDEDSPMWLAHLSFLPIWLVSPPLLRRKAAKDPHTGLHSALESHFGPSHYQVPIVLWNSGNQRHVDASLRRARLDFLRRMFAELAGTAILVTCHGILRIKSHLGPLSDDGAALFQGFTLVFLILSLGEVSGAHFNPVVTAAFTLRGYFPAVWVLPYWLMEFLGSLIAGGVIKAFYGPQAYNATSAVDPTGGFTDVSAMMFEAMLTFFLVFTILNVSQRGHVIGPIAAFAVGAVIAMDISLGAGITGGSMNPFRSLGPGIINGDTFQVWVFFAGPIIGMLFAVIVTAILASNAKTAGQRAAIGSGIVDERAV